MGGDGMEPMDMSPPPSPAAASKAACTRKRQSNGEREANLLNNTAAARPGHVAAHMASALPKREARLKAFGAAVEALRRKLLGERDADAGPQDEGAAPLPHLVCTACGGACVPEDKLFEHTVVTRDFSRKGVQLPRYSKCTSADCDNNQYMDPLYFGFFSANPIKKVRGEHPSRGVVFAQVTAAALVFPCAFRYLSVFC